MVAVQMYGAVWLLETHAAVVPDHLALCMHTLKSGARPVSILLEPIQAI